MKHAFEENLPKKRTRRTKEDLKNYYINPAEMEEALRKYYETNELTNGLADMIQKIGTRLGYAQNFINYSYKTEMIGDAIIKMMTAVTRRRFKCDAGYNPFSYFTKVAYRAFQNRIKAEKKRHEGLQRYQAQVYDLLQEEGCLPARKNVHEYNSSDDD